MAEIEQLQEMMLLLRKQMDLLTQQVQAASERLAQARSTAQVATPQVEKSRKGIGGRKALHIKCGMPGCEEKHQAQGLCAKHYAQVRRAAQRAETEGDPETT